MQHTVKHSLNAFIYCVLIHLQLYCDYNDQVVDRKYCKGGDEIVCVFLRVLIRTECYDNYKLEFIKRTCWGTRL